MSMSLQTIVPTFPREVVPGLIWTGGCLSYDFEGDQIHSHMCSYLLIGSERTLLVDTGHPAHWPTIEATLDRYLDGRPLDYVFPTHSEMPHAGSLERLLTKYPGLEVVGDVRDYHLFFPSVADRFRPYKVGESVSLGDREFVFVDAIWRDLPNTLWAYDTGSRTLFPADGFAYTHHHLSHECALTSTSVPFPTKGRPSSSMSAPCSGPVTSASSAASRSSTISSSATPWNSSDPRTGISSMTSVTWCRGSSRG